MKTRLKIILSALLLLIVIIACNNDDDSGFDHAGQALIDDELLKEYLETHFYTPPAADEPFGVIDTILNGETPLLNQVTTQVVNFENVDYNLYFLRNTPEGVNASPSKVDSVLVRYRGLLTDYSAEPQFDERISFTWILLSNTIQGWVNGFPNFKSGENISQPDMPLEYQNTGKGLLFIPSGLAYRELGSGNVLPNKNILFHVELGQTEEADHDEDGVSSNYEELNNDDDYTNDDTDGDNTPDYVDIDDDGDNILSRYETTDPNGDGNPSDALDTDGDNIPNYLDDDDDGDGIFTINENADANGNGEPSDAQDSDGDDIPDYLDDDTN